MLKKILIGIVGFILLIYIVFLSAPSFLTKLANDYSTRLSELVEQNTKFKLELKDIKFITTPKLTVGVKAGRVDIKLPSDEQLLNADNIQIKLSLIPILWKKIEIDMVGADNIDINLKVKKDGKFLIEDYLTSEETEIVEDEEIPTVSQNPLPFGIKLSNHLPNIIINGYNINFIDVKTDKKYSISGEKFNISDFILNKKIKISSNGKITLDSKEQFNYDIKLFNKIMPDVDLNDLVFNQTANNDEKPKNDVDFNVIEIFDAIYKNQLQADLKADIKTSGTLDNMDITGNADISKLSLATDGKMLPESDAKIILKNNKIDLSANLYSANDEMTKLVGKFVTGKKPKIDLTCKSNARFNSLINLADSVLQTFNINDLKTLSATGRLDADFNIKSDLKKLSSSGYIKIPEASFAYKLYNVAINKVFADIRLNNNLVEIKESGFSILGHDLKLKGTISHDAVADICLRGDNLQLKALLLTLGQAALLKDNDIKSGLVSFDVDLKGKLDKLAINAIAGIYNVNIKNPMMTVFIPKAEIKADEKDVIIDKSYLLLNNSRIDLSGKVTDYMSKNINFDISATGKLLTTDLIGFIPKEYKSEVKAKGVLPLKVNVTGNDKSQDIKFSLKSDVQNYLQLVMINDLKGKETEIKGDVQLNGDALKFTDAGVFTSGKELANLKGSITDIYKTQKLALNIVTNDKVSIVVPYFPKSEMLTKANINVSGTALNPVLKGSINIPSLTMPEMLLTLKDLDMSLKEGLFKGNGTLKEIVSGGIKAENLISDFELKKEIFYLNKMSGESFKGKINGDISYNISNGHIGVDIKGSDMDTLKAIEGAAGIKNALSGTLGFSAKVTTFGANDVEMMKNLKGKATFEINDGQLLNVGRFENFLLAKNLLAIPTVKTAVESVSSLSAVKNTSKFKTLDGVLNFEGGWATLNPVKMSGDALSYYITGKYNLTNGSANVIILGRLSAEVVKLLGPVGEMSLAKITTALFGERTAAIVKSLTSNPEKEKTENIPLLSSGNKNYKDFKVEFNGGVESTSSVKSFKWLSECDTSEINITTVKDAIENTKKTIEEQRKQAKEDFNKAVEEHKKNVQETKKQIKEVQTETKKQIEETKQQLQDSKQELQNSINDLKNTADEIKNMFKF